MVWPNAHIRSSGAVDIAIAYWGGGAATTLGLATQTGEIRVVCDAQSGACNPDELAQLSEMLHVKLHWKNGLHAKLLLTRQRLLSARRMLPRTGSGKKAKNPIVSKRQH